MSAEHADIAIVTVLPEEYSAVIGALGRTERDPGGPDCPNTHAWHLADLASSSGQGVYRVVVALAGRPGPSSGSIAVSQTVRRWNPRHVLLVGIAAGLPIEDLQKGDIVISTAIWDYEYGKAERVFMPRHDFTYQVDGALVRNALACVSTLDWQDGLGSNPDGRRGSRVIAGPVASGHKVIDEITEEFFAQVLRAWPKLQAIEMEGAGAAAAIQAAQEEGRNVGFLMVRGISDIPDVGTSRSAAENAAARARWKKYAATVAARFAVAFISTNWPYPGRPRGKAVLAAPDIGLSLAKARQEDSDVTLRSWLGAIHGYLLSSPGQRAQKAELAAALLPLLGGDAKAAQGAVESLQAREYLVSAPGRRYELALTALNLLARG